MDEYQGHANYPTWAISLWINNDQGLYDYWREQAADLLAQSEDDPPFTLKEVATRELSDQLRGYFEDLIAEDSTMIGPIQDIAGWSLEITDWRSIAVDLLADLS